MGVGVRARVPYENVFHCCVQRTGSQTIRALFGDRVFFRWTGLRSIPYTKVGLRTAVSDPVLAAGFPRRCVACHLYVDYPTYRAIPKPRRFKTFFVMRDPRDAVVSWYFAARFSHAPIDPVPRMRADLERLDLREGLSYVIDEFDALGYFDALRSWASPAASEEGARLFRYEDLATDTPAFVRGLLGYLEVPIPEAELRGLAARLSFEARSGGRSRGNPDVNHHNRNGIPGEWRDYLDDELLGRFTDVTGDLVDVLGYEAPPDRGR